MARLSLRTYTPSRSTKERVLWDSEYSFMLRGRFELSEVDLMAHRGNNEGKIITAYVMNISPNAYSQGYKACEIKISLLDSETVITFGFHNFSSVP